MNTLLNKNKFPARSILVLLLGALILGFMALYNGYPLTYPDSGTYIRSGFTGDVPSDRPITYGLFVRHSSMAETLWLTVFFQCLITAWTIRLFIRTFVTRFSHDLLFFITLLVLTFCTSLSQKAGTLLPDFITAPIGLLFVTWLVKPPARLSDRIISGIILVYGMTAHTSHLLIFIVMLVLLLLFRIRKSWALRRISLRRIAVVTAFIAGGYLLVGSINKLYSKRFFISQNQHVFLMNRLCDAGLAEEFLNRNCGKANYKLCPYKDSISRIDFLWDWQRSALYKIGGSWEENESEFNRMMRDMLKDPHILKRMVLKSAEYSIRQFFDIRMDLGSENPEQSEGSPSYIEVDHYYHHELHTFRSALQQNEALNYDWLSRAQLLLVYFSWFMLGLFLGWKKLRERYTELGLLIGCITIFCFANAFICGTLTTFLPRLQTRVVWLFPLLLFVMLAETGVLGRVAEKLKRLFITDDSN